MAHIRNITALADRSIDAERPRCKTAPLAVAPVVAALVAFVVPEVPPEVSPEVPDPDPDPAAAPQSVAAGPVAPVIFIETLASGSGSRSSRRLPDEVNVAVAQLPDANVANALLVKV